MLKRKMTTQLENWKQDPKRKVFLLLGARQTGKTFIVRAFAAQNYSACIEVNFLEDTEAADLLAAATSAEDFISRLSLVAGSPIEAGSLLFLDEVQHLGHEIVTLSKFLLDDGRFDVVLSGSLLGVALEGAASFPVGYAHVARMFPLDFEEFCWATGVSDSVIEQIRTCYRDKIPLEESLHKRLVQLYRQYIVVGGMPEAVQTFIDSNRDLNAPRTVDSDIVEQYRYDISKYVQSRKLAVQTIFDNVPSQLAKENKRFSMKSIKDGTTYDRLADDFSWLVRAGVVLPTTIVQEPKYPLLRTRVREKFKLYANDCGILLAQYPQNAAMQIVEGQGDANFGAVYENVIAQELAAAGFDLYYYHNNRKGEIDFLLETGDGSVIPLEVKSGKDYKRHLALNNLLDTDGFDLGCAYVFSEFNLSVEEKNGKPVYYLPLYMSLCLGSERGEDLTESQLEEISFEDRQ